MIHPPSLLVLPRPPRRDFAVTFTRLLPPCALYLIPIPRSIERSHNDANIAFTFPFARKVRNAADRAF
jgi:hypothetical protein